MTFEKTFSIEDPKKIIFKTFETNKKISNYISISKNKKK